MSHSRQRRRIEVHSWTSGEPRSLWSASGASPRTRIEQRPSGPRMRVDGLRCRSGWVGPFRDRPGSIDQVGNIPDVLIAFRPTQLEVELHSVDRASVGLQLHALRALYAAGARPTDQWKPPWTTELLAATSCLAARPHPRVFPSSLTVRYDAWVADAGRRSVESPQGMPRAPIPHPVSLPCGNIVTSVQMGGV